MALITKTTNSRGMSILEILIGCTIITIGILALINTYGVYVNYSLSHDQKVEATFLLEEGIEAVSLLRDQDWGDYITPLSTSATTSIAWNGSAWRATTTPERVDGIYLREIRMDQVKRTNGVIDTSGSGTVDTDSKLVTVYVSYRQGNATTTISMSKYLVNIYNN